ncbi:MAG: choice-of-anchor M domain-containing protein [Pirellulaceae bacterium]|nr:choice-of-anchor M domain-containing protein [Pirellulaceae bacterium]
MKFNLIAFGWHVTWPSTVKAAMICAMLATVNLLVSDDKLAAHEIAVEGHLDIGVLYESGQLSWHILAEEATQEGGEAGELEGMFAPNELAIRVPDLVKIDSPPFPGNSLFTGATTGPFWTIPSSGIEGAPFPGFSWDLGLPSPPQLDLGQWQNGRLVIQLIDADMPAGGNFSLWTNTINHVSTFNPALSNAPSVSPGTNSFVLSIHTHYNWGFTAPGIYDLTFRASGTHNVDGFKSTQATFRFLVGDTTTLEPPAQVIATHVYHSMWSGTPWQAIDTSKVPIREGLGPQTLGLAQLINTQHGINGFVFEVEHLADPGSITAGDFHIQWSPQSAYSVENHPPADWQEAPEPAVNVYPWSGDSHRILLQWPNETIVNRWLRLTMLANANTNLPEPATYYVGHLLGEMTGPDQGVYTVSFADITLIRQDVSLTGGANLAADITKNGLVAFADITAMRSSVSLQLSNLTVP